MTSGLTDHVWDFDELLSYKMVLSPWMETER
jgi:hypothetical protein